jgi:hypothetical protein
MNAIVAFVAIAYTLSIALSAVVGFTGGYQSTLWLQRNGAEPHRGYHSQTRN